MEGAVTRHCIGHMGKPISARVDVPNGNVGITGQTVTVDMVASKLTADGYGSWDFSRGRVGSHRILVTHSPSFFATPPSPPLPPVCCCCCCFKAPRGSAIWCTRHGMHGFGNWNASQTKETSTPGPLSSWTIHSRFPEELSKLTTPHLHSRISTCQCKMPRGRSCFLSDKWSRRNVGTWTTTGAPVLF